MILFEDAHKIVVDAAVIKGTERVSYQEAIDRILAEDISSDIDMPPFDKSAVDGYACKRKDINGNLKVIEIIRAGDTPENNVASGECSKIMTGAKMPEDADCVIMVEDTEDVDKDIIRLAKKTTATNICYKSEDIKSGQIILEKSKIIRPQDIAMFASVGYTNPLVFKLPEIAVISTGNELTEPDEELPPSKIRNSNSYQLIAQAQRIGCKAHYMGIAKDTPEALDEMVKKAFSVADIVLLSGGVSMGDYDFVPQILAENGVDIKFQKVAIQPGKPTLFGKLDDKYVFGLPGNPVSSFTLFEMLVKPFIYSVMGYEYKPLNLWIPLANEITRRKTERDKWIPAVINEDGKVEETSYNGSAHIHSLSFSQVLFRFPRGEAKIKKDELVYVRQI